MLLSSSMPMARAMPTNDYDFLDSYGLEPAGIAKRAHEIATGTVDVVMIDQRRRLALCPFCKPAPKRAMHVLEERPGEVR